MVRMRRMNYRARLWMLMNLPAGMVVRPLEWFLAVVCAFSGLLILTGLSEPRSASALLPEPIYYLWGSALLVGSLFLICGLSSIRWLHIPDQSLVTRVPCYRLGLRLLGLSAGLLAIGQFAYVHWDALPSAGITLYFAVSCGIRLLTLREPGDD